MLHSGAALLLVLLALGLATLYLALTGIEQSKSAQEDGSSRAGDFR